MTEVPDTAWIGRPLVLLDTVDSTNLEVWRRVEAGAGHGLVVAARTQTAGRGRRDRTWISPDGEGVYATILVKPGAMGPGAALFGLVAAVAAAQAVEDVGVEAAKVKWPNDVWVGDRKIAGILTEARDATRPEGAYVVGIGINVAQTAFPDDLRAPATSVCLETGEAPDPYRVLERLLVRFEFWADALIAGKDAALDGAFAARDMLVGREISFRLREEEITGEVLRISPLTGLRLRLASGEG